MLAGPATGYACGCRTQRVPPIMFDLCRMYMAQERAAGATPARGGAMALFVEMVFKPLIAVL